MVTEEVSSTSTLILSYQLWLRNWVTTFRRSEPAPKRLSSLRQVTHKLVSSYAWVISQMIHLHHQRRRTIRARSPHCQASRSSPSIQPSTECCASSSSAMTSKFRQQSTLSKESAILQTMCECLPTTAWVSCTECLVVMNYRNTILGSGRHLWMP